MDCFCTNPTINRTKNFFDIFMFYAIKIHFALRNTIIIYRRWIQHKAQPSTSATSIYPGRTYSWKVVRVQVVVVSFVITS